MADIIFADTTRQYDGQSLNSQPLGASESSVIYLARELVRRNHRVSVFAPCPRRVKVDGVVWRPLIGGAPHTCDLYIGVQHPELLGFVQHPKRRAIWLLWQPNHLEHYERVLRMWWYQYAGGGKGIRPRASDGAAGGTDGSHALLAGDALFGTRMPGILHGLGRGPGSGVFRRSSCSSPRCPSASSMA
jgi:hypothetical protein